MFSSIEPQYSKSHFTSNLYINSIISSHPSSKEGKVGGTHFSLLLRKKIPPKNNKPGSYGCLICHTGLSRGAFELLDDGEGQLPRVELLINISSEKEIRLLFLDQRRGDERRRPFPILYEAGTTHLQQLNGP